MSTFSGQDSVCTYARTRSRVYCYNNVCTMPLICPISLISHSCPISPIWLIILGHIILIGPISPIGLIGLIFFFQPLFIPKVHYSNPHFGPKNHKKRIFHAFFCKNIWWIEKKAVPLHPLSKKGHQVDPFEARFQRKPPVLQSWKHTGGFLEGSTGKQQA